MSLLASSLPLPQPRVRSSEAERVQVVEKELTQLYNRGLLRLLKTTLEPIGIPVPGAQQIPSAALLREGLIKTVVSVRAPQNVQFPAPWIFSLYPSAASCLYFPPLQSCWLAMKSAPLHSPLLSVSLSLRHSCLASLTPVSSMLLPKLPTAAGEKSHSPADRWAPLLAGGLEPQLAT